MTLLQSESPVPNTIEEQRTRRTWRSLLPLVFAVVGSIVACYFLLELWNAHLGLPFDYGGDSYSHALNVWQVGHNGWFWSDHRLGAPFTEHFQDWPVPDVLPLFLGKVLALFSQNWPDIVNGMFLVSFPLVALTAWWVLRKIGVSPWTAAVIAIIYDFLPYHLVRAEYHLFLSGYYTIPLAVFLAYSIISGQSLFPKRGGRNWLTSRITWIAARTVLFAALVAMTDTYYAAFTLLFIAVAAAARVIVTRRFGVLVPSLVIAFVLVAMVVVDSSGAIVYHWQHGANPVSAARQPQETELYGLKLSQMVLPVPGHRISALASGRTKYDSTFPLPGEGASPALGFVAAFGLLWLIVLVLAGALRPRIAPVDNDTQRQLGVFAISGFLVATIGGFASIISLYVSSEIRSWDRMSIFIGFFALAAVGLLLDAAFKKLNVWQWGKFVVPLILAVVLVAGLLDQTNKTLIPNYKAAGNTFLADRAYFSQIEATLPKGASVFELPLMQFPESAPINGVQSYDLLRPYLATKNVRWSFGGIKGRLESAWQDRLQNQSVPNLLHALAATGFQGLYIDRAGYADNATDLEKQISGELDGQQPLVGQNGMGSFFDLRAYVEKLRATDPQMLAADATTLLFPVYPAVVSQHFPQVEYDTTGNWRWADGSSGVIGIDNAASSPKRAIVTFSVQSATGQASDFTVNWPDGSVDRVRAGGAPVQVTKTLTFKAGSSGIRIASDAPKLSAPSDSRDLHFRVDNLKVTPA